MPKTAPHKPKPQQVPATARILSWNINGIRAAHRNGLAEWFDAEIDAGLMYVGFQEVRARADEIPAEITQRAGWTTDVVAAKKKGYSGVSFHAGLPVTEVATSLGDPEFDDEGRFIEARIGDVTLASVYFPNGNGSTLPNGKRSNDRVPYKLAFTQAVSARYEARMLAGEKIIVMGDFNTAHREVDLARPKTNRTTSGFLDIEREEIDRWVAVGWIDAFRHLNPDAADIYSWWSQRFGIREKNIGWRIDMIMVTPAVLPHLTGAFIDTHVRGSDHCPVGISVEPYGLFGLEGAPAPSAPTRRKK